MLTPHSPVPPVRPEHRALLPPRVRTVPAGHDAVKHQTFEAIDNDYTPIFTSTFPTKADNL